MGEEQDDKPPKEPPKPRPHIGVEIEKKGRDPKEWERKDRDT